MAYARKLTDEQVLSLKAGIREKVTIYALAKAFGVTRSTVRYYMKKVAKEGQIQRTPSPVAVAPVLSMSTRKPYVPTATAINPDSDLTND